VDDEVALVLKVHPSNFRVEGFTASVPVRELARLSVPVVADIGSGLLRPHPRLPAEPDATTTLRDGAALVTASGDKLLGGPQGRRVSSWAGPSWSSACAGTRWPAPCGWTSSRSPPSRPR
jgi:hypothetical protein